jgi:Domain of unknown function (DUF5659)
VSTGQARGATGEIAFETRDFYLACFLRCTGYELIDLRAEGPRKIFVFRDRATRAKDVMAFYGNGVAIFFHHKGHEGAAAQCVKESSFPRHLAPIRTLFAPRWN